jgi:gliding motility-associated-like protein
VGGEVYYDYLGSNNYRFYFAIYRDCHSTGAAYDSPLPISVFNGNNVRISDHNVPFPGSVNLPIVFNNPCITPPADICTERAIYTIVLNLPPSASGYIVAYQRCCRGPAISNLSNPSGTGLTIKAIIPPSTSNFYINSSARFINYPPLVICNNENLNFNHAASDPDGDSLSYELVTPHAGATAGNPAPNPIPAPPYSNVIWAGGYSPTIPLGSGSTTTINPTTGQLFVDANSTGLFVVGIRVNEWRNGVKISYVTRDFLFKVVNCNISLVADINEQETTPGFVSYCNGLTFTFDNLSYGATNYYWDFGVSGSTNDNSTASEPTYTFPTPGTYHVMLIANPGWPCTDTAYIDVILDNPFEVDFTFLDSTCFKDNTLDFTAAVVVGNSNAQFQWNFGPNANPQVATGQQVNNVAFNTASNNVVKLIGTFNVCIDSISKPIFFYDAPNPQIDFEVNHECNGFTQQFLNNSTGSVSYQWDFGVASTSSDVSTNISPIYTFPSAGTYPITLISSSGPGCSDTVVQPITIYEPLVVNFTHNDSLCISDNSFDFVGSVSGPPQTTWNWNFGTHANPTQSSNLTELGVVYDQAGSFPVTLTASFLQCEEVANSSVYIFPLPFADFTIVDELRCVPYPAHFINLSSYPTTLIYSWDFGDGGQDQVTNPTHVYSNAGTYNVSLTAISTVGCVDTLFVLKQDYITVHPKPTAGFQLDKTETTICDSQIQFIDASQDASNVWYYVDENNVRIEGDNPRYTYITAGMHYPVQVVQNEFGCTDTARLQLTIEPFTVFVPNTFTPNDDLFNACFRAELGLIPVEWELKIYDRWGEVIFVTNDFTACWDGTYKGKKCQDDIYTYVIHYVSCEPVANATELTGHVTLIR